MVCEAVCNVQRQNRSHTHIHTYTEKTLSGVAADPVLDYVRTQIDTHTAKCVCRCMCI